MTLHPRHISFALLAALATGSCAGPAFDIGSSGGREARYRRLDDSATERRRLAVDVPEGGHLVLFGFDGTLVVRVQTQGDRGELVADLKTHASSLDAARGVLAGIDFELKKDDNARMLRLVLPRGNEDYETECRYELRIPQNVTLEVVEGQGHVQATGPFRSVRVTTADGDVRVSEVKGDVALMSDKGDVSLAGANGDLVTIDAGHGKVEVSRSSPGLLRIAHRSGGVRLWQVEARRVELTNQHGPLELQGVSGELVARTGHGNVQATDVNGSASLETRSGSLSVQGSRGTLAVDAPNGTITIEAADGDVTARSKFGSVLVQGRFRSLRATTEVGEVHASLAPGTNPKTPLHVASQNGDVTVSVPYGYAFRLDAQTQTGTIETSLPMVIEASRSTAGEVLRGQVRGGGPLIEMRSRAGRLRVVEGGR